MPEYTQYIELVTHPHPYETLQARLDFADIMGSEVYERPWFYRDVRTGRTYYDLIPCIGWPDPVTAEKGEGQPGYIAIIGVVRPQNADDIGYDAKKAVFYIIDEAQHLDVPTLLKMAIKMRNDYGFGINADYLSAWYGDYERFATALALLNEKLGERSELIITPPDDYNLKNRFEIYLRALKGILQQDNQRLYFGSNDILKNRLREFKRDDPAVTAVGGLVHTLLTRQLWMGQREEDNAFVLKEL